MCEKVVSEDPFMLILEDDNFDEDDPETIIRIKLITWNDKSKLRNACKKK